MKSWELVLLPAICYGVLGIPISIAHEGRLNSEGCHNQSSDRTYHCHQGPLTGQSFANRAQADSNLADTERFIPQNYRREDYLISWTDKDGDCQNLRHEMLIRGSLSEITFTNPKKCTVSTGKWLDPYTGAFINQASDIDVDHVIPLAYAHRHGGYSWSANQKRTFAIDESNLLLVDDGENQFKGAKGPSKYLPRKEFQCEYARTWLLVAGKYKLDLQKQDLDTIREILILCQSPN
tara:strand:+ start:426 stop:1133 length:708 start_codon:yes stop_codon:yes gene_type:complete